jgi:hypothetical protein
MMNAALRLISLILIALALMLLGADAVTSLDKGGVLTVRSVEQVWAMFSAAGVASFRAWAQHHWSGAATHIADAILTLPGWALAGVIGVILNFVSGRSATHTS